jgi:anti-sigma regulatory factor (Ser/Thr protein kinase)
LHATFYLDNDPDSIPPLVDYVQQIVGGLELSDETERIRAAVALEEALVNAMCHGNLELTAEELDRGRAGGPDGLRDVIARRRSQSPYCDRKMVLDVHVTNSTARFVIRDDGGGFERLPARRFTREDCFQNGNGFSVALMNMLMDDVSYNEIGNELTLIKVSDD